MTFTIETGKAPRDAKPTFRERYSRGYTWALSAQSRYGVHQLAQAADKFDSGPYGQGARDAINGKPNKYE